MRKKLLLMILFLPCLVHAQGTRYSSQIVQKGTIGTTTNVVLVPAGASVNWCAHPANAVPCTNKATTYTDATLGTPCATSTQITLDGTTTCIALPDANGNWGIWVGPGAYDYTITIGTVNYGPFFVTAPCVSTGCTFTTPTITSPTITNPTITGTVSGGASYTAPTITGTIAGTPTITTPTLTTPIINGTSTGTGIPTITLKKGSGSGNYTTSSTSYVDVQTGTELQCVQVIPTGWKLAVSSSGTNFQNTGIADVFMSLFDSATLIEVSQHGATVGDGVAFALNYAINGDGASHTVKLQYKTTNGSDAAGVSNSSATNAPAMICILLPSN